MFGESVGKKLVKLIVWFNWFNVGVGIMFNLVLLLTVLDWAPGLKYNPELWDFLYFNRSLINRNGFYLIAFVTGLILIGIRLNVLLTNAVEKCDEQNFLTWFKRTARCAIVEWCLIGYMFLPYNDGIRFFMAFARISGIGWIYITLRIIYPIISYLTIFRIFFHVKLFFRSQDYKSIQSPAQV